VAETQEVIVQQLLGNLPRLPSDVAAEMAKDIEVALRLNGSLVQQVTRTCVDCGGLLRPKEADPKLYPRKAKAHFGRGLCRTCYWKVRRIEQGFTGHKQARGSGHGRSKLTEDDVRAIRDAYADGATQQLALAEHYGVGRSQISDIVNRKCWTHI
jgi:hypothetical protein